MPLPPPPAPPAAAGAAGGPQWMAPSLSHLADFKFRDKLAPGLSRDFDLIIMMIPGRRRPGQGPGRASRRLGAAGPPPPPGPGGSVLPRPSDSSGSHGAQCQSQSRDYRLSEGRLRLSRTRLVRIRVGPGGRGESPPGMPAGRPLARLSRRIIMMSL